MATNTPSAGAAAISAMENHCMDTSGITTLPLQSLDEGQPPFSTAQYVAVNDANKDLVLAMADMSIFSSDNGPRPIVRPDLTPLPELIVIDANWSPSKICDTITRIRSVDPKSKIVFEPVSVAKSAAIFEPLSRNQPHPLKCFPNHLIDLAAPNKYELASMHASAKEHEFFASDAWWHTIDSLGIPSSGARDRFVALTNREMTDEGIPLQKIQLLPLIPRILTKLGADGVLLTELLKPGDTSMSAYPLV
jgi:pseudouridine-5'-phosphate glycosidase/pseudouridine kinase